MNRVDLVTCRPGLEEACRDECADTGAEGRVLEPGLIQCADAGDRLGPLIFERQRLPDALGFPPEAVRPVSAQLVDAACRRLEHHRGLWTVHALAADASGVRPEGLRRALAREIAKRDAARRRLLIDPEKAVRKRRVAVVQLLAGVRCAWLSVADQDALPSPHPGGILRMPLDPAAPSRSYLKLEEAFHRLDDAPRPGDRVVDLGAAPGGWSYACLKRGAVVTAVDNGPIKIRVLDRLPGRLQTVRANGLTWRPLFPTADWLLSDMLIPPGQALGLLKAWMDRSRCRNLVVTVKLPQQRIWPVLKPVLDWLNVQSGWAVDVKHLYHDRREVTVMARRQGDRDTEGDPPTADGQPPRSHHDPGRDGLRRSRPSSPTQTRGR